MNDTISLLGKLIRTRPVTTDPERVNAATAAMREYLGSHGVFCRVEEFAGRHILYASNRESGTPDSWFDAYRICRPLNSSVRQKMPRVSR